MRVKFVNKFPVVIPTIPSDVPKVLNNLQFMSRYLEINNIVVIGNKDVERMLPNTLKNSYINESEFIDIDSIKTLLIRRTGDEITGKRAGWYAQQFIKMSYANVCSTEYYLLWDSDTIPLHEIELFEGGVPYLDYKTEFHKPYFQTISNILPGYNKIIKGSFIAEHMLINTSIMKSLLKEIEFNINLEGKSYIEKVLNSISANDIGASGFSEFETYGTYTMKNFPNKYKLRKWKSMRYGAFFFDGKNEIEENTISWLARSYDAISFEKGNKLSFISRLVDKKEYKKVFEASSLELWSFLIRAKRRVIR